MKERRTSVKINMMCKGLHIGGDTRAAEVLLGVNEWVKEIELQLEAVTEQRDNLQERVNKLEFTLENGLGFDDLKGGNVNDVS